MKVLLGEDNSAYRNAVSGHAQRAQVLQAALNAYTALGLAAVPTTADLAELWTAPRAFLVRMITGGAPMEIAGIAVKPDVVYDLLAIKPAGADEFVAAVTNTRQEREGAGTVYGNRLDTDSFELVNGIVRTKQAVLDTVREHSRYYATTQAQLDEWNLLRTIAESLNSIRTSGNHGSSFDTALYLHKALVREGRADNANPVKVNPQFVISKNK